MIHDPVADWRELSALYEQADLLGDSALREWLAALPPEAHRLLPRLEKMLAARTRAAAEQFMAALPSLGDEPEPTSGRWEAGRRIGAYRLIRHIGSGGMAEVWLAERADGTFERQAAVKLLFDHPSKSQRDNFIERFRRERDILASLDHANIARLYDAGVTADAEPWLALEYVEGNNIVAWCDEAGSTTTQRVRLFLQVLAAVEHAHARLVIHRDIKPSNVQVGKDGRIRLLDFGISKLLQSGGESQAATALTRQGGSPLTPEYASPEQLRGESLTTACDVYSLGVLLYQLLEGDLPYEPRHATASSLVTSIAEIDPVAPSRRVFRDAALAARSTDANGLRRDLHPDLDAIVLHALEKAPDRRYASAGALRADLERWLADEPVLATVQGPLYRVGKFARRHRVGVGIAAVVTAILVGSATFSLWQSARAHAGEARALAAKQFLLDTFRMSDPAQSKGGDVPASQLLDSSLERANRVLADQPELRAEVLKGLADLDQHLNRYAQAQSILIDVADIYAALGKTHEWTETSIELAEVALRMGDTKAASTHIERSLPGIARYLSDRPLQARQREVRGWLDLYNGDLAAARVNMSESLNDATAAYGRDDPHVADALRGLAAVEEGSKDYALARLHIEEAHRVAASASSATNEDLVGIEIERARIEFSAGQLATALPQMRQLLTHCDATLGGQNEDCYFLRALQALALLQTGEFAAATTSLPTFLREARNDLSPERQAEATIMAARVTAASGQTVTPEVLLRLARIADPADPLSLTDGTRLGARLALVEIALRDGRPEDADRDANRVLSGQGGLSAANGYRARALMLLGLALQMEGRHREALQSLGEADKEYVAAFGADHTEALLCRAYEVPSLLAVSGSTNAVALLDLTLPMLRARMPADAPVIDRLRTLKSSLSAPAVGARSTATRAVFF
jgi:serine/threonine-protein kinase